MGFCCRRLFKGMFSVLVTSLAVLLAGLLMIYAFFAVYEGPNAIEWGGGGDLHRLRCVVNAVLSFKALTNYETDSSVSGSAMNPDKAACGAGFTAFPRPGCPGAAVLVRESPRKGQYAVCHNSPKRIK